MELSFFILISFSLIYITVFDIEAYPFSSYPMFSESLKVKNIKVIRIALENINGDLVWWESKYYRNPQIVGKTLKKTILLKQILEPTIYNLQINKILLSTLRLIELEETKASAYKSFHIIERSINHKLETMDKTISIIPFEQLKNG
jgi:hypothetical protein